MNSQKAFLAFAGVLSLSASALYIASFNASFDPLVISIIGGIFIGNLFHVREHLGEAADAPLKAFLPAGIALYGTQLEFTHLDWPKFGAILLVFAGLFCFTFLIARVFNVGRSLTILLSSGLAVCGASAVAVISPLIGARREDTSVAVISVMMLGLTGMIFYPIIFDLFGLTRDEFNFLTGSTLPMIGQVRVAAGAVCPECLPEALRIKLVRVSFLLFVVTFAVFLSGRERRGVTVPWFVVAFVLFAVVANVTDLLAPVVRYLRMGSSFLLSAGLAAVGLTVSFDAVIDEGVAPLGIIFFAWSLVVLLLYLVRNLFL